MGNPNPDSPVNAVRRRALRSVLAVLRDPASRPVFRLLAPMRTRLVLVTALSSASAVLEGLRMASLLALLTALTGSAPFLLPWLGTVAPLPALIGVLILSVIREGVEYARAHLSADCQRRFVDRVRERTLAGILAQPYSWFTETQSGEAAYLVNAQVSRFSAFLPVLSMAVSAGGTVLMLGGLLVWTDWRVAAVCAGGALLMGVASVPCNRLLVRIGFQLAEASSAAAARVQDALRAIKLVKASRMEESECERCNRLAERVTALQVTATTTRQATGGIANLLGVGTILAAVSLPGAPVLGTILLALRALPEWTRLRDAWTQLASNLGFIVQVTPFLGVQSTTRPDPPRNGVMVRGANVTIGNVPILHDVSLVVRSGQTVALMGVTGSGKSTILDVIAGLRGADGFVRAGRCAYLPQDPGLLYGSVRENIGYGAPKAIVRWCPVPLEHEVGEAGVRVSGGQRQLIGLDRVVSQGHPVWLLDEPTAHLDPKTEGQVCRWLRVADPARAVLIATHRVVVANACQYVYVLHNGRVVEEGSPQALRARGGRYAVLVALQEDQ